MNEAVVTLIIQVISSYRGGSCPHVLPLVLPVDTVGLWVRDLCTEEPDSGLLPRGAFRGLEGCRVRQPQLTRAGSRIPLSRCVCLSPLVHVC